MNEKPELKVDWCTYKAAKYACENWHYSKCLPVGKLVKIGIWEDNKYIGCVLYGRGACQFLNMTYNIKVEEICELVRIALTKHKTAVSQIVAESFKFLKKQNPKMLLIVSFADADQNHIGVIYQAGNWIYTGLTMEGIKNEYIVNGKYMHCRTAGSKGHNTIKWVKENLDFKAVEHITKGKHKYLMPLDKKMRRQIIKLSKPYPKKTCPEGVTGSTSGFQPEGIGSSPISGLKPIKTGEVNGDAK